MTRKLIEAESFRERGGWLIETQSMPTMGSAYLMAHGMGIPVADAVTETELPAGNYTFWARTRDWTKVWGRGKPAGRFTLNVNGVPLETTLGTGGSEWSWQRAGSMTLPGGKITLALHDLTGFNGRCDAIYITSGDDIPREDADFRREITGMTVQDADEEFDLIVAGGGMAGTCTAIAAIRSGLKVLLVQDRSMLGGCNSSEVRVSLGGVPHAAPYPNIGNVVAEIGPIMGSGGTYPAEYYEDNRKKMAFELSKPDRWKLLLNTAVVDLERDGNRITAVITRSCIDGSETRYRAKLFADCTGDGTLARMMGCETMYGTEAESDYGETLAPKEASNEVMGQSVLWLSSDTGAYSDFPEVDFGIEITDENVLYVKGGDWEWESGQYRNQATEAEYIRDYAMMAIYANWSYLKHHSARKAEYANRKLDWVSPIGGKRESYRVIGDYVLTQNDIEEKREHADATAAITWDIDLHYPDPKYIHTAPDPYRSCAYHRGIGEPYPVPYRCLYAKDAENLFLGGRIISCTHVAFAAVRVMRTLGQLGEVIGMAAAVCKENDCLPRDVYTTHFEKLAERMRAGVPVPAYHSYWPRSNDQRYHIKELGMLRIPDDVERIKANPELLGRIAALNITHLNGKKITEM